MFVGSLSDVWLPGALRGHGYRVCALREGVGGLLIRGPLSWLPPVYWVKL